MTTPPTIRAAVTNAGIRNGSVWPTAPTNVIRPHTLPRSQGLPRPLNLPSSERPSEKAMLMPAPMAVARPTSNAVWLLRVAKAAANRGASEEMEPSIRPARPGWTTPSTNARRWWVADGSTEVARTRFSSNASLDAGTGRAASILCGETHEALMRLPACWKARMAHAISAFAVRDRLTEVVTCSVDMGLLL